MDVHWSGSTDGELIEVERRGGHLYLEGGRPDWPGRGHEGWGGTWTIEQVRRERDRFLGSVPGLYERVMSALVDRHRVVDAAHATLELRATDGAEHGAEVRFLVDGDHVYVRPEELAVPTETLGEPFDAVLRVSGEAWSARLVGTASLVAAASFDAAAVHGWMREKHADIPATTPDALVRLDVTGWE